jgi:hypothetical protein
MNSDKILSWVKFFYISVMIFLLNGRCTSTIQKSNNDFLSDARVNISRVECMADSSQSYYIAVPEDFNTINKWPLVMVFDPKGNGKLAVESLKSGVQYYGFIIAGSNVIRNGYENPEYAFRIFMDDVIKRYPVNPDRIYAAGFSGGGRYAQNFSQVNTSIKAIISMGAGFSLDPSQPDLKKVPMLFLAGNEDFNYLEIISSYEPLKISGIRHLIFEFNGKHEWPDHEIISEALLWYVFDDCRRTGRKDPLIENYKRKINENADNFKLNDDNLNAVREYEKGIAMLTGLTNTKTLIREMNECKILQEYKDASDKRNKSMILESRLQQGYISALNGKDTAWWKNEIFNLNQKIGQEEDPYLLSAYRRVKSFVSVAAYSLTNLSLKANDLPGAKKILEIYHIVDPGNPDVLYFRALYFSKTGQPAMAIRYFTEAADSGFTDFDKAKQELPENIYQQVMKSISGISGI